LLAADGLQNKQIAVQLKISTRMVGLWRSRFLLPGVAGLLKDAPRPGRTPSIPTAVIDAVIYKTTQTTQANATHWSTRTMAREVGISEARVRRICTPMGSSRTWSRRSRLAATRSLPTSWKPSLACI
jgi:transposase